MNTFTSRLLRITTGCRDDMHEPDDQGLSATVVGSILDNAFGEYIDNLMIDRESQELVVIIHNKDEGIHERFNLASLIALARIGASTDIGKQLLK